MQLDKYHLTITFTAPVLGTAPANQEIYEKYVRQKAVDAGIDAGDIHEPQTLVEVEQEGLTVFRYLDEYQSRPYMPAYMFLGYFKEACGALRRGKTESKRLTAYKKVIDLNLFIEPDCVELYLPDGEIMGRTPRPLRAETAQGPRVALADSETAPAGTHCELTILVLHGSKITEALIREWLDYGRFHGMGQWRNGGYGRFCYEIEKVAEASPA